MADKYDSAKDRFPASLSSYEPARNGVAVTPSDTTDLATYAKALYIGTAGDIAVIFANDKSNGGDGTPVLFVGHPAGYAPLQVRRVMSTNTAADDIVALYD